MCHVSRYDETLLYGFLKQLEGNHCDVNAKSFSQENISTVKGHFNYVETAKFEALFNLGA